MEIWQHFYRVFPENYDEFPSPVSRTERSRIVTIMVDDEKETRFRVTIILVVECWLRCHSRGSSVSAHGVWKIDGGIMEISGSMKHVADENLLVKTSSADTDSGIKRSDQEYPCT